MVKRILVILLLSTLSSCAWTSVGPQNKYVYPDPPKNPQVLYMSPLQANGVRDICVTPEDKKEELKNLIEWTVVYEKMKAIIDSVNGDIE